MEQLYWHKFFEKYFSSFLVDNFPRLIILLFETNVVYLYVYMNVGRGKKKEGREEQFFQNGFVYEVGRFGG